MIKTIKKAPQGWPKGKWSKQALKVLRERYLWKNDKGKIIETPEGMIYRVAQEAAQGQKSLLRKFYQMIVSRDFFPNSPTLMNAGKGNNLQYSGCFVIPITDSIRGIFGAIEKAALIHKSGGGTGFSFSSLRPSGAIVGTTGGIASGPVSFMRVFDSATNEIKQGGTRRGANMGILRVDHPDILEFIKCKTSGGITNFNISIAITDEFMEALKKNKKYYLRAQPGWPKPRGGKYKGGEKIGKLSAKGVFDKIVEAAWKTGDPGVIWLDKVNNSPANPVPEMGPIEATNPCGEQPLYPNEACNLGSINLANMVKGKKIDWNKLKETTQLAVRFLDDVIDVNPFPFKEITEIVLNNRRIGLGVMGWADMLFKLEIPYDSSGAVSLAKKVMRFIDKWARRTSEELAEKKGPFPNFKRSIYRDGKPRRNAAITTIAPTGSISIIAGCSSGIEPAFALAYTHQTNGRVLDFINPVFEKKALNYRHGRKIVRAVKKSGFLTEVKTPKKLKDIFKTAHEIQWRWHIRTQAAFQKYVDNAVSKTINLPSSAGKEEVRKAYLFSYRAGCKGITVFRDGCKGEQVLNAGEKKEKPVEGREIKTPVKPRPQAVKGFTYRVATPVGTAFVTINHNGHTDHPLEVFVNVGKAGSDVAADAEAIGRLISLCLRISSPGLSPRQVAELIVDQLKGIGGGSSVGFGKKRVRSLADGLAYVIKQHLLNGSNNVDQQKTKVSLIGQQTTIADLEKGSEKTIGDICPSCGHASLIYEEGCSKCFNCGFSKC